MFPPSGRQQKLRVPKDAPQDEIQLLVNRYRKPVQPLIHSSFRSRNSIQDMLVGQSEGADQADALVLGPGRAVPDHDGAPDDAVGPAFEDLRHARSGAGRLGEPYRLHRDPEWRGG